MIKEHNHQLIAAIVFNMSMMSMYLTKIYEKALRGDANTARWLQ